MIFLSLSFVRWRGKAKRKLKDIRCTKSAQLHLIERDEEKKKKVAREKEVFDFECDKRMKVFFCRASTAVHFLIRLFRWRGKEKERHFRFSISSFQWNEQTKQIFSIYVRRIYQLIRRRSLSMPNNCSTLIQRKQNILHKILRSNSEGKLQNGENERRSFFHI